MGFGVLWWESEWPVGGDDLVFVGVGVAFGDEAVLVTVWAFGAVVAVWIDFVHGAIITFGADMVGFAFAAEIVMGPLVEALSAVGAMWTIGAVGVGFADEWTCFAVGGTVGVSWDFGEICAFVAVVGVVGKAPNWTQSAAITAIVASRECIFILCWDMFKK